MLKIILVTLAIQNGNVAAVEMDYFDTIDDCELFAAMMQEEAVMRYRFGYDMQAYVCEMVEEMEA